VSGFGGKDFGVLELDVIPPLMMLHSTTDDLSDCPFFLTTLNKLVSLPVVTGPVTEDDRHAYSRRFYFMQQQQKIFLDGRPTTHVMLSLDRAPLMHLKVIGI
jgi:hypothetical protein